MQILKQDCVAINFCVMSAIVSAIACNLEWSHMIPEITKTLNYRIIVFNDKYLLALFLINALTR